jgi:putative transposase
MAVPRRHGNVPGTYFVTSRTWESRQLFITGQPCLLFVETLLRYRQEGAYSLHAFVLMPDHFHLLLTPARDKTLERAVQLIKGGSARMLGLARRLQFPVWQRGFSDHRVRDAVDYANHLRYVEQNPIRKRLVADPSEYRWSSARGQYEMDEPPQGLKPQERQPRFGTAEAVP